MLFSIKINWHTSFWERSFFFSLKNNTCKVIKFLNPLNGMMYSINCIIGMAGLLLPGILKPGKFTLILDSPCYLHCSWKGIIMFYLVKLLSYHLKKTISIPFSYLCLSSPHCLLQISPSFQDLPKFHILHSAVDTGWEKVSFHPKIRGQCQRMFKLSYNCTHFTC